MSFDEAGSLYLLIGLIFAFAFEPRHGRRTVSWLLIATLLWPFVAAALIARKLP